MCTRTKLTIRYFISRPSSKNIQTVSRLYIYPQKLEFRSLAAFYTMADRNDDILLFIVEWFDPLPQLKKKYVLKYFNDHMIEMIDVKTKKLFLKKSVCPKELTREDFFVGSKILLYSRELEIVDFGDIKTRQLLQHQSQFVAIIIPSKCYSSWGDIIHSFHSSYTIARMKSFMSSASVLESFNGIFSLTNRQTNVLNEGVNLVLIGYAEDGFNKVKDMMYSLRHLPNFDGIFYSSNGQQTNELQELLFNNKSIASTVTLNNSSCVIIKPHAVKSRLIGLIFNDVIQQGYEISAVKSLNFDKTTAEEFLEVYKGVLPEYQDYVIQLSSGLCLAMEIRAENAVQTFRFSAGPWDTSMAKELYPNSIRGKYGIDNIRNAVHCTDLAQDAIMECEYVFNILD